jgi:hypothetical protein
VLAANLYGIRFATDEDRDVIHRLVTLDSSAPISGYSLIGEIDGVPVAVMSMTTGRVAADPFRRSDHLVSCMRIRAAGLRSADETPSLRERIRAAMRQWRVAFATRRDAFGRA